MKPPVSTRSNEPAGGGAAGLRARNRPHAVAGTIKDWIIAQEMKPGDRLPQERDLIASLGVAKSTVREALKLLEAEGLVRTRTGPGGGAFITAVGSDVASSLLANHFLFQDIGIAHIYELRIALEPQLVADLARRIDAEAVAGLRARMRAYAAPPASMAEEREQRLAELEFHEMLAGLSGNPLMRFVCGYLIRLLKELAVCRRIYERPNPELRESGLHYQERLVAALEQGSAGTARTVMEAHMREARRIMLAREAELTRGFLPTAGG
jgi:GntR family transcriptional regulator, transcriptional repressor for pyruvate dehydrogenase complex